MNPPPEPRPETHATLEELVSMLHRKRAATPRYVMQWGLVHTTEWIIDASIPDRPYLVHLLVDSELLQRVREAANAHGVSIAAWLRHAMRQVTPEEFPASWRAEDSATRSHESGNYGRKFGMRLDAVTSAKLALFTQTFDRSAAEAVRSSSPGRSPRIFRRAGI
jgi:hypothetical protein